MAEQNLDIVVRIRGGQVVSQQVKTIGKDIEGVGTASQTTAKKTSGLKSSLAGVATGFAVYKGFNYIKGAVGYTSDLAKATLGLQRITGLDSQQAAGWIGIAKERGIQSKALNQGFITLNKQIYAAANGSKGAQQAFAALGLDGMALKVLPANLRMGMLAESFKALPPGVDKAALAGKLFGRQAQSLLPIMNQSARGLNDQVSAMGKQLGMTNQGAKGMMDIVKAEREWGATQNQLKVAIALSLLPVIQALVQAFLPLLQGFANLMTHSKAFSMAVVVVTGALVTYVVAVQAASLANIAFIATIAPWLAIAVAIGLALVLLYQKCGWFRDAVHVAMGGVVAAFNWVKQAAVNVWSWIKGNWPLLVSILGGPIAAAIVQVITHFNQLKSTAISVFNAIKGVIQTVASFISSVLGGAFRGVETAVQGVVSAIQSVIDTAKQIENLPGKVLKALNPFGQHGLYMSTGGTAIVGEAGPEMVRLPQGAQVMPFVQGSARGGGGGQVVVPVYLDKRQIALAMGGYTADEQAAR